MADYGFWQGRGLLGGVIPLSPAWNASYRVYRSRMYTTSEVKQYKVDVAKLYGCSFPLVRPSLDVSSPWMFGVASFGSRLRRSDSDSRLKLTKDAVFAAIGLDDAIVRADLTYVTPSRESEYSVVLFGDISFYEAAARFFLTLHADNVTNASDAMWRLKTLLSESETDNNEVYDFW